MSNLLSPGVSQSCVGWWARKRPELFLQSCNHADLKNVTDLPPVKPSAIALGTVFSHAADLAILAPLFGDTYQRAKNSNTKEEFLKSKEAASAGAAYGSSLIGAGLQTYGVAALINATGTLSYKGAAYLGALVFLATASPGVSLGHRVI